MQDITEKTIGEIVAEDYRAAAVFQSLGIDFCCKGNRTINEVCEARNIEPDVVFEDLAQATASIDSDEPDYITWSLDRLTKHIEDKHHRYVEEKTPIIKQYLEKVCQVHGNQHPELYEILKLYNESAGELAMHMKKEELMLFPYINKMMKAKVTGEPLSLAHFGAIKNPIQMMMADHENEGGRFEEISKLSDGYSVPADACNTFQVVYYMLKEFEEDLHLHIHLENNILFPKAIEMEETLAK